MSREVVYVAELCRRRGVAQFFASQIELSKPTQKRHSRRRDSEKAAQGSGRICGRDCRGFDDGKSAEAAAAGTSTSWDSFQLLEIFTKCKHVLPPSVASFET